VYLNDDGSSFIRYFSSLFGGDAPSSITEDTFLQSEVVHRYQENKTHVYREASSPGSQIATWHGGVMGSPPSIGRRYQIITTYEVTVTRHWYNRTTYYQNRNPAYTRVYKDEETRRLINTEIKYLD
jgi:hypothetical protein